MSRIELCVNTKFGGDSIVDIDNIIKKARKLKLKGIAFSDLNDINSFYKVKNDSDINIIYGTSLKVLYNDVKIRIFLLVKNKIGLTNLYKIMSLANIIYLESVLPIDEVFKYIDGLLIGINVTDVKIYNKLKDQDDEQLLDYIKIFDYILVSTIEDHEYVKKVVNLFDSNNKIVCATNDVRYEMREDKVEMDKFKDNKYIDNYLMSDDELINNFSYLGKLAKKIVIDNTCKLSTKINKKILLIDEIIYGSCKSELKKVVYELAKNFVDVNYERIDEELKLINDINAYNLLINYNLVNFSQKKHHEIFPRGNISALYIAYILGISNINPIEYKLDNSVFNNNPDNLVNIYINYDENIKNDLIDYFYKTYKVVRCGTFMNYDFSLKEKGVLNEKLHGIKKKNGRLIGSFFVIPNNKSVSDYMPVINLGEDTSMIDYNVFKNKLIKINIIFNSISSFYNELINKTKIKNFNLNDNKVWESITKLDIPSIDIYTNDFTSNSISSLARNIAILKGDKSAINDNIIFKEDLTSDRNEFLLPKAHALELAIVIYKIFYIRYYDRDIYNKISQKYEEQ